MNLYHTTVRGSLRRRGGRAGRSEVRPVPEIVRTWFSDRTILSFLSHETQSLKRGCDRCQCGAAELEGWAPWEGPSGQRSWAQWGGSGVSPETFQSLSVGPRCSLSKSWVCVLTLTSLVSASIAKPIHLLRLHHTYKV